MTHPFAILGIPATSDAGVIKRAYFAALARFPPHRDAEAFQRLRAAYELLCDPLQRGLALMRAPVDASSELAAFEAEWGARVERCAQGARAERDGERALEAFVARTSKLTLLELGLRVP